MDIRSPADFLEFLAKDGAFSPRNEETSFSLRVEPIIRGLVTLEKALPGSLCEITACRTTADMYDALSGTSYRRKFLAYNRMAPGAYIGSDVFGVLGEIGLQAIIVETGVDWQDRQATTVALALSTWVEESRQATLTTITWGISGATVAESFAPFTTTGKKSKPLSLERKVLLQHLLGIKPLGEEVHVRRSAGSINYVLGGPGAEGYLETRLPVLGDYLAALAERLRD